MSTDEDVLACLIRFECTNYKERMCKYFKASGNKCLWKDPVNNCWNIDANKDALNFELDNIKKRLK